MIESLKNTDGESRSIWPKGNVSPGVRPLDADLHVDVCVIGGGIGGMTTAYLLRKEGKAVCVLEAFDVASGQSERSTAQFSTALGDRYFDVEKYHGSHGARLAAESHRTAIALAERIALTEAIECDLARVDGFLFCGPTDKESVLERELEAAHRAGLNDVHLTSQLSGHALLEGEAQALCFPKQLQLDPVKYVEGLARCFVRDGGRIYPRTPVVEVTGGESCVVTTKAGAKVYAKSVVVATNSPIIPEAVLHTKQAPYRTYVIGLKVPDGRMPQALYWDTLDPYHYVRMAGPDVVLVGGEDHKTGQESEPEERYERLEQWARDKLPFAQEVVERWSGQVMETVDALAFVGPDPGGQKNVFVLTGDSGNGMTHGTLGAALLRDQINGTPNAWSDVYAPARISVRAAAEYIKENVNVALQYLDWLTPKSREDLSSLANGDGLLVRDGLSVVAVYKDEHGAISRLSATCPHLGGIVHWNSAEKSWDCPCHGSRFGCRGDVIEGPAKTDLRKIESPL